MKNEFYKSYEYSINWQNTLYFIPFFNVSRSCFGYVFFQERSDFAVLLIETSIIVSKYKNTKAKINKETESKRKNSRKLNLLLKSPYTELFTESYKAIRKPMRILVYDLKRFYHLKTNKID